MRDVVNGVRRELINLPAIGSDEFSVVVFTVIDGANRHLLISIVLFNNDRSPCIGEGLCSDVELKVGESRWNSLG